MALVATYGNLSAFNIKIYDMVGGGYYAALCDGSTQVFQRRNNQFDYDIRLHVGADTSAVLDHFLTYSYNGVDTLTLSGCSDSLDGVAFTRVETYRFVSAYVVEDTLTFSANGSGSINGTNWNFYSTIDKVWDIDNSNFGDGTSTNPLGFGVQLTAGGSVYGVIGDSQYGSRINNRKRSLASRTGIAVTWIKPGDSGNYSLTSSTSLSLTQWFYKSQNTLTDFILQGQLAVAVAKGYTGSQWRKIAQVTGYFCIGLMDDVSTIKLIPSAYYNGMWMRDSFWLSLLTNVVTPAMEANAMGTFETNQQVSGAMPTMISSDGTAGQLYHDESSLLYIIRSYHNYIRRGVTPNMTALANCVTYIATQVTGGQWLQETGATQSWADTYIFTSGQCESYNQGIYALAMKCALRMGVSGVTSGIRDLAITQYQALYDSTNKFIPYIAGTTILSPLPLAGEALSIWLLNEKMLTDIQVGNHLSKLVSTSRVQGGLKLLASSTGSFLSAATFNPQFGGGDYQNGATWFLYDFLAFYAGFYHNFYDAGRFIYDRIATEIIKEPLSHEYLITDITSGSYLSEPVARHVYAWNAAYAAMTPPARQPVI